MADLLRIGFMPLADAAIIVAAARLAFDAREDLRIELCRETSWANVRDRLAVGQFDAAHLLAPMPVAAALRRGPLDAPIEAPMALGLGGNVVAVSQALWTQLQETGEARPGDPVRMGRALRRVVRNREAQSLPRLVLAVVHAYSAHNYELRHWLAASGVAPDADVTIGVVPPALSPEALASGAIDGFCVGEPWGSLAAERGVGRPILVKEQIWSASPEKVLGLRADRIRRDPDLVLRLLRVLLDASQWCADPANRRDLTQMLAAPEVLNVPESAIAPVLGGGVRLADGTTAPDRLLFAEEQATYPWRSHARFFAKAMARWRQADPTAEDVERATQAYRPDLYRIAAASKNRPHPLVDEKPARADAIVEVEGDQGRLSLSASRFFDEG